MSSLLTCPTRPIVDNSGSHRSAHGEIYVDMIRQSGDEVEINYGGKITDHNQYDKLYVYHGNDWSGVLNFFGGVKSCPIAFNLRNFSRFQGEVISLGIDFPDYGGMLEKRMDGVEGVQQEFLDVDLSNLGRMYDESSTLEHPYPTDKLIIGDSHTICMYREGWMIESIPFKTLYGVLDIGLSNLHTLHGISEVEYYFGNIDIRHHLCRQDNPEDACIELVDSYVEQMTHISSVAKVSVYEPLLIERESRKLPKSGYYKGQPFWGEWSERNEIRNVFVDRLRNSLPSSITLKEWTNGYANNNGELDFRYMEDKNSVHLARHSYPYWTGLEKPPSLERFFSSE